MIVKRKDFLNLSEEDIAAMPLKTLRHYLKKAKPNYCQLIDEEIEIGSTYISRIMGTDIPAKTYRSAVDARARELLSKYVKEMKEKNKEA